MQNNFVIVGDTILDRFVYGDAVRISPEAPALVLDVRSETNIVGGAFNVYSHIYSLGGAAKFISVTGNDIARYMEDFPDLVSHGQDLYLVSDSSRVTSIKTRLISRYKLSHLLRFDKEATNEINEDVVNQVLERVAEQLNSNSSLLIIDYNKGVVTKRLSRALIGLAQQHQIKVYVDSKKDEVELYRGAYMLKPNKVEFHNIKLRYQLPLDDDISACRTLLEMFDLSNIVLTLGSRGMMAVTRNGPVFSIPANEVSVKELSGAGDSALAVLSLLLSENVPMEFALAAANNVAARFISTGVTYRAKRADLVADQAGAYAGNRAQPI